MKKIKAYNKMFDKKGNQIGKAYLVGTKKESETKEEFKKRIEKDNKIWNKKQKNNYTTKAVKFSSEAYYKKKSKKKRNNNLFGFDDLF